MNLKKSIEQLENDFWPDLPDSTSSLIKRCHELRKKKLSELSKGDLRVLINQGVGLKYLVPIAIKILMENPFIEAEYYEGDMLNGILTIENEFWGKESKMQAMAREVSERGKKQLNDLDTTDEIREDLEEAFRFFDQNFKV